MPEPVMLPLEDVTVECDVTIAAGHAVLTVRVPPGAGQTLDALVGLVPGSASHDLC